MFRNKNPESEINPLVSIIVPFYNREEFLVEAIESVLAQSEEDWELLLIDDGSEDRSVEIVKEYIDRFPSKIHLFSHEGNQNKGASASRNLGLRKAKGAYITFLDSDDVFFDETLTKELKAFENNPDADAVSGTLRIWYSWSEEADKSEKDFNVDLVLDTEKLYYPPELLLHNLRSGGRKPGMGCVMLTRNFVNRVVVFEDEIRRSWEDQVFWARVSAAGKIYVMDEVLAKYRQHPASTCAVESRNGGDVQSLLNFLEWLEDELQAQQIEELEVWKALRGFRRTVQVENKLVGLKQLYRRILPLHLRYKMRDSLTKLKRRLSRPTHRHK